MEYSIRRKGMSFIKKHKTLFVSLALIIVVLFAGAGLFTVKNYTRIQNFLMRKFASPEKTVQEHIWKDGSDRQTIYDQPKGFSLCVPSDMEVNTDHATEYIRADKEGMSLVMSREWSPYLDTVLFIDNHLNNYYLNENYIEKNNITIHENEVFTLKDARAQFISLTRNTDNKNSLNNYNYLLVHSKLNDRAFFRVMIKTDNYEKNIDKVKEIVNSFEETGVLGTNYNKVKYAPVIPENWNEETKNYYKNIVKSKKMKWGVFVDGAYTDPLKKLWLDEMEEKLDFAFDFSLYYVNLTEKFPVKELQKFYDEGKITELTLQVSYHANDDLFGKNLNFDLYDGKFDETIRSFARGAKEFGHPFLFRLNNEMNSDWVNYSGVAALSDPDIFVSNWRRIYDIFEEEGVDNAIWVFNPNAEPCPPVHYNSFLAYYPGDKYVHAIGLTGYNTGTYYQQDFNEQWRSFDEIYRYPYDEYMKCFSRFPFIITEFSSSSVGGDKAEWIKDMFASLPSYPNIKMALWWSSADYDLRDGKKILARPYWLDETEETTNAFKDGVKNYK
jgi:hypothetical protein